MKNRIFILILTLEIIFLTGCTTADTVNHNLTKEADEFKAYRRMPEQTQLCYRQRGI